MGNALSGHPILVEDGRFIVVVALVTIGSVSVFAEVEWRHNKHPAGLPAADR
ncbi:hypothetical protein [Xylella taiwanensis]|nr:hypothetical protein [Xylella taiwanensis]MCD8466486.1 hypothetical protein [Xylella taiwanensis]MCD8468191.1 hypothetical protein [Xylella taiwanensis]